MKIMNLSVQPFMFKPYFNQLKHNFPKCVIQPKFTKKLEMWFLVCTFCQFSLRELIFKHCFAFHEGVFGCVSTTVLVIRLFSPYLVMSRSKCYLVLTGWTRDCRFGTRFSILGFGIKKKLILGSIPGFFGIRNSTNSCNLGSKMCNCLKNNQF